MAKKFFETYNRLKQDYYNLTSNSWMTAIFKNSKMNFEKITKPNGKKDGSTAKYNTQISFRLKTKEVDETKLNRTSAGAFAIYDAFQEMDWETLDTATGKLRVAGYKIGFNEEYDMDGDGAIELAGQIFDANAQDRREQIMKVLIERSKVNTKTLDLTKPLRPQLKHGMNQIRLFTDDVKAIAKKSDVFTFINPLLTDYIATEVGTTFNQEAPVYFTGIKSEFSIDKFPVWEVEELNKYEVADKTKRVAGLQFDVQFVGGKKDAIEKKLALDLGVVEYNGEAYYDIVEVAGKYFVARAILLVMDATGNVDRTLLSTEKADGTDNAGVIQPHARMRTANPETQTQTTVVEFNVETFNDDVMLLTGEERTLLKEFYKLPANTANANLQEAVNTAHAGK